MKRQMFKTRRVAALFIAFALLLGQVIPVSLAEDSGFGNDSVVVDGVDSIDAGNESLEDGNDAVLDDAGNDSEGKEEVNGDVEPSIMPLAAPVQPNDGFCLPDPSDGAVRVGTTTEGAIWRIEYAGGFLEAFRLEGYDTGAAPFRFKFIATPKAGYCVTQTPSLPPIEISSNGTTWSNASFNVTIASHNSSASGMNSSNVTKDRYFRANFSRLWEDGPSDYASLNGDTLDDFTITADGSDVTILSYWGNGGNLVIPEGVTKIGMCVFSKGDYSSLYPADTPDLTSVKFPSTLKTIDHYAFDSQTSLTGVLLLPEGLTTINGYAFNKTAINGDLVIPASVTSISTYTFGDTKIKSATINSPEVTTISPFFRCSELESVTAKGDITIKDSAFRDCTSLKTVNMPYLKGEIRPYAFNGCTNLETLMIPEGVTGIAGATNAAPFAGSGIKELIFPESLATVGLDVFNKNDKITDVAFLRKGALTTLDSNAFRIDTIAGYFLPNVYVFPDSELHLYLLAQTGNRKIPNDNFKTLVRKVQVTVQNESGGGLLYANTALDAAWDDSDHVSGFTENIKPSFEPTVLDALGAAIAENASVADMLNGDAAGFAFTKNGEKHPISDAGTTAIQEGDKLHFFVETGKTFFWFEQGGVKKSEITLAPGLEYELTLKSGDGPGSPVADTAIYIAYFNDLNKAWVPANQSSPFTDENGVLKLKFEEKGTYILTPFDFTGENKIAYDFLSVTVYSPDNGIKIGSVAGTPAFETSTPLSSGYDAGTFVKLDSDGTPMGAGFDSEHTKYRLYVNKATTNITLPIELNAMTYAAGLTLSAIYGGEDTSLKDAKADPATGKFGGLSLALSGDESTLVITTACDEQGETFTRTYEIAIVRDSSGEYAGIRSIAGVLGQGIGKNTFLTSAFVLGAESYSVYIYPGQQIAPIDITVNKDTEVFVGTRAGGIKQSTIQTDAGDLITYRVALDCSTPSSNYTITTYLGDESLAYTIKFVRRSPVSGVYTPDTVVDYHPAKGQFTSELLNGDGVLTASTYWGKFVSLGEHGGYVTYYYDDPITNDPNNKWGVDFIVYGNSFAGSKCNEPAGAQVSYDGVTWYDLAGQRHYELLTRYVKGVPLLDGSKTESLLLLRAGDPGYPGGYPANVDWGYADVASCSKIGNASAVWNVDAVPYNPYRQGAITNNFGDMFDLSWAVDRDGKPVDLDTELPDGIRYIRLQNVIDVKDNGAFGEISPEIGTITRVNPADVKDEPVGLTPAPKEFTINGIPMKDFSNKVETDEGRAAYYDLDLKKLGSTAEVHVKGEADDNIFVNMEGYHNGEAEYSGLLDADGSRTVRVVIQNGEMEPRIYVINCTNGGDPAENADLASIRLVPGDVTLTESEGKYTGTVANAATGIKLAVSALNPSATIKIKDEKNQTEEVVPSGETSGPLSVDVGENAFTVTITSTNGQVVNTIPVVITRSAPESGPPPKDTITVWFEFTGDDIHYIMNPDDKHKEGTSTGLHNPKTWIKRQQVNIPVGSTAKYLTDMMLLNNGITYSSRDGGTYIEWVEIPEGSGNKPEGARLEEFSNGPNSGWMYRVNDIIVGRGYADQILKRNDSVLWFYTDDYTKETGYEGPWNPSNTSSSDKSSTTLSPPVTAKDGAASVAISASDMTSAIADAKKNDSKAIVIAPEITGTAKKVSVDIPKNSLSSVTAETKADLTVRTPVGNMTIPNNVLSSIAGQASGSNVTVSLESVNKEKALTAEQKAAVGDDPVYDVSIMSGGKNISSFGGGSITVSLPYTLKDGEDPSGVTVWYLNDKGELERMKCTYDKATGLATFTTDHLSYYVVGWSEAWTNPFTDVKDTDWFYGAVEFAVRNGLFNGTAATTFSPDSQMTRAMLVTVLYRLEGSPAGTGGTATAAGSGSFTDVKDGQWYTDAVTWASANGIAAGMGNGLFGTDSNVTREQLATILYNYANYKGYDIAITAAAGIDSFDDAPAVSAWAQTPVKWANGEKLITGRTADTLAPGGSASRAEVATILQRFVQGVAK